MLVSVYTKHCSDSLGVYLSQLPEPLQLEYSIMLAAFLGCETSLVIEKLFCPCLNPYPSPQKGFPRFSSLTGREQGMKMSVTCHSWLTCCLWGLILTAGVTSFILLHNEALHSLATTFFWLLRIVCYPCLLLYKCNRILCIVSNIIFWCVLFTPSQFSIFLTSVFLSKAFFSFTVFSCVLFSEWCAFLSLC